MNDNTPPTTGGGGFITLEKPLPLVTPEQLTTYYREPTGQCCGTCDAFVPNKAANPKSGEARQGWCRAKPPLLVQVMVPEPGAALMGGQARMVPAYQGLFPPTADDACCREWGPKPKAA